MSITKTRDLLYSLTNLLGDLSAIQKGTVGKRVARRAVGKEAGKELRKLLK